MDGPRRTGSALTGRPLGDNLHARTRQLSDIVADLPNDPKRGAGSPHLEGEIAASIETINKVTETYGVLLDKLSAYETKVRDLTGKLAEEERTTGDALRAAARAEEAARDAQTKATLAEGEAERAADKVRALEHQLAALRAQTVKLMDAVEQLFPDLDEDVSEPTHGLRVVR